MSSIINKVKDAVKGDKHHEQPEGTHGTHNNKAANAADPRIDSDRDHRANPASTTGHSSTTGTGVGHSTGGVGHSTGGVGHSTTTGTGVGHTTGTSAHNNGPHDSAMGNKVDPRIDSDRSGVHAGNMAGQGYPGSGSGPEGAHGPHSGRVANAADPRVDSDRDASRTVGNAYGSSGTAGTTPHTGAHGTGMDTHGTGLTGSSGVGSHTGSGMTGSHGTSGMTGSGMTGSHGTHGTTGSSGLTGNTHDSGMTGSHGTHGTSGMTGAASGLTGAQHTGHQQGIAGSGNPVTGGQGHQAYNAPTGTHGTHNNKMANAADPRIDSDRDHRGAPGDKGTSHVGSGPGPAANTAGPHSSDMMNKVDPRVDSDLDGSKTVGGNKTYQSTGTGHKDPHDAAQVPPSVMQKHVGAPVLEHDDHVHDRERRHSTQTHQEKHSGI